MPSAPHEARIDRFRDAVNGLTGNSSAPLGVAVSGGPDSLALLLLCEATFPGRTRVATVDHGLRPESANEAAFVALLCKTMGVPHATLKPAKAPDGNVSDWARTERYGALENWAKEEKIGWIMTGHHADDQLETVIMRLNRGSGVGGLSGVRARHGMVIRPLLGWRREELEEIVDWSGLMPIQDPSNIDDRFDRARLRKALAGADWLDPVAASRSAGALAEAEAALEWAADRLFSERTSDAKDGLSVDAEGLPAEFRRRLVLRILAALNPEAAPRGEEIARLLRTLESSGVATLADVRCQGGPLWRFARAPARQKN